MLTVMYTMATGRTTKLMDMVFTITLMGLATKAGGSRISNTEKAKRFGQIMLATKDSIRMARSMVMVSSFGPMDQLTLVTLLITTFMDRVFTPGQMDVNTMVNGTTIRCTDREFSLGMMDASTRANTLMTKARSRSIYLARRS